MDLDSSSDDGKIRLRLAFCNERGKNNENGLQIKVIHLVLYFNVINASRWHL